MYNYITMMTRCKNSKYYVFKYNTYPVIKYTLIQGICSMCVNDAHRLAFY